MGLLMGVLVVFGRMGGDHELTAVRAAGIGLAPMVAPAVLFGLGLSGVSLVNNSFVAPASMTQFKLAMVDLGRNNPTVFLRAGEPIRHFGNLRLYVERKAGNRIEGVHCWELDRKGVPKRSIRADYGIVAANLAERSLDITLYGARQEERGPDPTEIDKISAGMRASQLPLRLSLAQLWDTTKVERNITVWTLGRLGEQITRPDGSFELMPLLTEVHKRLSFSTACFTFCILGIPLALMTHRREASVGFAISLGGGGVVLPDGGAGGGVQGAGGGVSGAVGVVADVVVAAGGIFYALESEPASVLAWDHGRREPQRFPAPIMGGVCAYSGTAGRLGIGALVVADPGAAQGEAVAAVASAGGGEPPVDAGGAPAGDLAAAVGGVSAGIRAGGLLRGAVVAAGDAGRDGARVVVRALRGDGGGVGGGAGAAAGGVEAVGGGVCQVARRGALGRGAAGGGGELR
ncbi:MAG: YjgP/YjgQ family permease [Bdellovibrionaceae bacterium]|nr:YjgP/YjgQ family permease [Pseudobdellovibrionaceae bacterium]